MATFVLVHGAWHGSWCWQRVRAALQQLGHEVFTPTLTGVGERSHLLAESVDLQTHVLDVVNLIQWEELKDVILCGHSYGGMVVTSVADRIPQRIRSLVLLDAFVPQHGQSLLDFAPIAADQLVDGWKCLPISAETFGVNAAVYTRGLDVTARFEMVPFGAVMLLVVNEAGAFAKVKVNVAVWPAVKLFLYIELVSG